MADVVVFDTEALTTKPEEMDFGEYRAIAKISIACLIEAQSGLPVFYSVTDEPPHGLWDLAARLEAADEVVTFNGKLYDIPVLEATLRNGGPPLQIRITKHTDVYAEIRKALGGVYWPAGSWKLGRIARDTLGVGKSSTGAFAPELWRRGRMGEIATYVYRDVWITWKLLEHIREHGWVRDPDGHPVRVML